MRHVHGHGPRSPATLLREAADWCEREQVGFDQYGTGEAIERLEAHVAERLGFEAGRFMPSGIMAQTIAMRVHARRQAVDHFGMPHTSHLERHEERSYAHLHDLRATLVGAADRPLLADDLRAVHEPLAALLVELPLREIGGQLPSWSELEALKAEAQASGIPLHLDGARLWSCGPAYARPLDSICAGFDTAYVSFYKSVGALSGAMLLGSRDFIDEAAVWQRRAGGTLWSQIPSIATAAARLERTLERMPDWVAHARALSEAIAGVDGVRLRAPCQTNLFHVVADGSVEQARSGRVRVQERLGIRLFGGARPGPLPDTFRVEISIFEPGLAVSPDEAAEGWRLLMQGRPSGHAMGPGR